MSTTSLKKRPLDQISKISSESMAKFFYKSDPPANIKYLEVEIEPINPLGKTDKATYGLQPGEEFHNTKIRNDRLQTFGTDLILDKELMKKIKRMIQRKRGQVFDQEDAVKEGHAHHNRELRQQNLDKFLEIFYYPVKLLMKYIESKPIFKSHQSSIEIKDISDLKISNSSASYTINISLRNDDVDDEDNHNFIFKIIVEGVDNEGFDNEEFYSIFNEDDEIVGGYKKRRRITKRKRISKKRKNSKRRKITKRRK